MAVTIFFVLIALLAFVFVMALATAIMEDIVNDPHADDEPTELK